MQNDVTPATGPLRAGYLATNPLLIARLAFADALLRLRHRGAGRAAGLPAPPRRILVSIGGHLGDAVIASAVLPRLRHEWPNAEIGVLAASWMKPVLAEHPLISRWHVIDHWKLNRSDKSFSRRLRRYSQTRKTALTEIATVGYDLALDLYPFYPNSISLLAEAGIPVRAGFTTGGYGRLLTHPVEWGRGDAHVAQIHGAVVDAVAGRSAEAAPRYDLPNGSPSGYGPPAVLGSEPYLVLHAGAGLERKEWPIERWQGLAARLLAEGHRLVFTGTGEDQEEKIRQITAGHPGCIDLCGRQSWSEFVSTVGNATLLITVDSVAGHLAGASGTPVVVLMTGMNPIEQWRPLAEQVSVVTAPVACAPCHRSRGCEEMSCIRSVSVASVLSSVHAHLAVEPVRTHGDGSSSREK